MNKKVWLRKTLVLASMMLFVGAGIIPSTGTILEKITIIDSKSGSYIQDLIDNASDGDTINIPSGMYNENIVIDKSINLVGENKYTTVIDGNYLDYSISINANNVSITGFNIIHGNYSGIELQENVGSEITGNIISDNRNGIDLYESNKNTILGNNISSNYDTGIILEDSRSNTITDNIISNNHDGIFLLDSRFNIIKGNTISNNCYGIYLFSDYNDIQFSFNIIFKNNFIDNEYHACFENSFRNRWILNYWNETRLLPKLIHGVYSYEGLYVPGAPPPFNFDFYWFNIDWRPALRPYNI